VITPIHLCIAPLKKSGFVGIGNQPIFIYGKLQCCLRIKNQIRSIVLFVVSDGLLPFHLLIGRDTLQLFDINLILPYENKFKHIISISNKNILPLQKLNPGVSNKLRNENITATNIATILDPYELNSIKETVNICNDSNDDHLIPIMNIDTTSEERYTYDVDPNLSTELIEAFRKCIDENYVYFDPNKVQSLEYEMHIHLENNIPLSHPRRLSYSEKAEVRKMVQDLLSKQIIRPSDSPYASPIVLVKKKRGILVCV